MAEAPPRVAVVGMSVSATCGVRAHARILSAAMERTGYECSDCWLSRGGGSLREGWQEVRSWRDELGGHLRASRPDVALLHYSVFAFSHRGFPVFIRPTVATIARAGVPLVVVMHEFAYPWRLRGWRGGAWAISHRALLIEVMRSCSAAVLTTDFRLEWLSSRRWLPRRPLGLAPVFSNLPPGDAQGQPRSERRAVGLFGYSYEGLAITRVLDGIALLARGGIDVELVLLGAPGRDSELGGRWVAAAAQRGIAERLSFRGPLEAQELSNQLATCEVLLFADLAGPSSRKGSLAGSLASGRPVVAVDGPRRWAELDRHGAARIVEESAEDLADGIAELLEDEAGARELGARGRRFADEQMGVARTTRVVSALVEEAIGR